MRIAVGSDHAGFALKEHVRAALSAAGHEVVDVGEAVANEPDGNLNLALSPDDLAYVIYTSGSTGQPRRVVKPIACLDWEASALAGEFSPILAGSRIIGSVSPQHLYGLTFRIVLPLALGLPPVGLMSSWIGSPNMSTCVVLMKIASVLFCVNSIQS